MLGKGVLMLVLNDGWEGSVTKRIQNIEKPGIYEFEVNDGYEWENSTSINDGSNFCVYVEWQNSINTRKECVYLQPYYFSWKE